MADQQIPKSIIYVFAAMVGTMFLMIMAAVQYLVTGVNHLGEYGIAIVFLFAICILIPYAEKMKLMEQISSRDSMEIFITASKKQSGFTTVIIDDKFEIIPPEGDKNELIEYAISFLAERTKIENKVSINIFEQRNDEIANLKCTFVKLYDPDTVEFMTHNAINKDIDEKLLKEITFNSAILLTTLPFDEMFTFVSSNIERKGYIMRTKMSYGNHAQLYGFASTSDNKTIPILIITHTMRREYEQNAIIFKELTLHTEKEIALSALVNMLLEFHEISFSDLKLMAQRLKSKSQQRDSLMQELERAERRHYVPKKDGLTLKDGIQFAAILILFAIVIGVIL